MRKTALSGLIFNVAFASYHIVVGAFSHSWWLLTTGIYYAILGAVRYVVLLSKKRNEVLPKFAGVLLIILTLPLLGTVILASVEDRGKRINKIIMIAMAVYAFTKITIAIINLVKSRKSQSVKRMILRNVSFADACVSIFALQRSMLVSFGNMPENSIRIFNASLGSAVCITALLLGIGLLKKQDFPKIDP